MAKQRKSVEKGVTCAVAIFDGENKLLLVHPTNAKHRGGWSLPKGMKDDGETAAEAACREVREETGMIISPDMLRDLGRSPYTAKKDFHLFTCTVKERIVANQLSCVSTFDDKDGIPVKEVDKYVTVTLDAALELLNQKQGDIVSQLLKV